MTVGERGFFSMKFFMLPSLDPGAPSRSKTTCVGLVTVVPDRGAWWSQSVALRAFVLFELLFASFFQQEPSLPCFFIFDGLADRTFFCYCAFRPNYLFSQANEHSPAGRSEGLTGTVPVEACTDRGTTWYSILSSTR